MQTSSTRPGQDVATVIALHASASSGAQWAALRDRLEPAMRVIAPDLHGHGAGPAWHGFDADIVAADAVRVARLATEAGGDVHLVGHSYGAAIALRVALHHPRCIASVSAYEPVLFRLLSDYNRRHALTAEVATLGRDVRSRLRNDDAEGAARAFVDYWNGRGTFAELKPARRAATADRMRVIGAHFAALAGDGTRLSDLRTLRVPALLLFGNATRAPMRRIGELLRYAMPQATFGWMTAMGHMGPVTNPHSVAQRVAAFIGRHARGVERPEARIAA